MSKYAPDWVLHSVCSTIATRFVEGNLPIEAYANRMSKNLKLLYSDCDSEKLYTAAERMLFFLAELEEENAIKYFPSFVYNSVVFEKTGRRRKMKGFFYNPLAPAKIETTSKNIVTSFRAFVFRLRNDGSLAEPGGWRINSIEELKALSDILTVEVTFADAIL